MDWTLPFLLREGIEMSNVILKTLRYAALSLVSSTVVANPSACATAMLHNQVESPSRNSHKINFVVYTNRKYRFRFSLPESWRGYSISLSEWQGGDGHAYQRGETMPPPEKGPLIIIRDPLWTESNPGQNIPIMIFTKAQWKSVEAKRLIVSAARSGRTNSVGTRNTFSLCRLATTTHYRLDSKK
jgi:hypothetical protein